MLQQAGGFLGGFGGLSRPAGPLDGDAAPSPIMYAL